MHDHTESERLKQEQPLQTITTFEDPKEMSLMRVVDDTDTASGCVRKSRVLLAISVQNTDAILHEIATNKRPRRDFLILKQELDADIIYPDDAQTTLLGSLLRRFFGARIAMAWAAYRRRHIYDYIVSDTEKVGLPLALLMKLSRTVPGRPKHTLLTQNLTPFKKRIFFRLGVGSHIDTICVLGSAQYALATERLHMPKERVIKLPYYVDTQFWLPAGADSDTLLTRTQRPMIFSAGLEHRDYHTLFAAVRHLDLDVVIAAASVYAFDRDAADKRTRSSKGRYPEIPPNVVIKSLGHKEMRQFYSAASFVVVPLLEVDDTAGISVILEAMAMGKAVIVTGNRGQTDVVRDPRNNGRGLVKRQWWPGFLDNPEVADTLGRLPTGFYVAPGDPDDLRDMIQYLLHHPEIAAELGSNGRRVVEEYFRIETFAQRHAAAILGEPQPGPDNYLNRKTEKDK